MQWLARPTRWGPSESGDVERVLCRVCSIHGGLKRDQVHHQFPTDIDLHMGMLAHLCLWRTATRAPAFTVTQPELQPCALSRGEEQVMQLLTMIC